jgi:glycine/D-amino acid oxidase-like deaminating enzyme
MDGARIDRARAVVVGGGITASVAYHLAKAGWRDTVLVEKDDFSSVAGLAGVPPAITLFLRTANRDRELVF